MLFRSTPLHEDESINAGAEQLLRPFADGYPEIATQALENLPKNATYLQLGQTLFDAVQHILTEQEQTCGAALHDVRSQLMESQREVDRLTTALKTREEQLERLQAEEDGEIQSLKETIRTQNRILSRQQKKLQSLLGATEQESET